MTLQELYEDIGGSYDSVKRILPMDKLIEKFILKFPEDKSFEKLSEAWKGRDGQGMFDGAHMMKGVCANLGLDRLSAAASEIAEEFRPGNARRLNDAELDRRMEELTALYERTVSGIRGYSTEKAT